VIVGVGVGDVTLTSVSAGGGLAENKPHVPQHVVMFGHQVDTAVKMNGVGLMSLVVSAPALSI
jgi:hypothetical protein